MVAGFTITDFKGEQEAAISFIREVCVLENPSVANNIVSAGTGINIWTTGTTEGELSSLPFTCVPIIVEDNEYLVVSLTDFPVSFPFRGRNVTLKPTEFLHITPYEIDDFDLFVKQRLLTIIPTEGKQSVYWILRDGTYNDSGIWMDTEYWID